VIRLQMQETRTALTEKLEALETQVVQTVQDAKDAVTETVDSVREAVHDTVDTVKGSMQDTVESVKEAFDLERQVERHPWTMVGGSVALGYLSGCLFGRMAEFGGPSFAHGRGAAPATPSFTHRNGGPLQSLSGNGAGTEASRPPEGPSVLTSLADTFHNEIGTLKGLAIGAAMGLVRDLVAKRVPPQMSGQLTEVIDSITTKLGGEPVRGPVLNTSR